ncbi:MAG: hypothetical protein KF824_03220 [Fimbriimonadaceae bacterium]|nr:MAG: hypothetical protein KF824_03220 [Fimbriimonadaceae bacterium]
MKRVNLGVFVLLLILVTATVVFVFGSGSGNSMPSTTNPKGLGLAAFGELMQSSGIPYESTRSQQPVVTPKDLLITADQASYWNNVAEDYLNQPDSEPTDKSSKEEPTPLERTVEKHLKSGGRILQFVFWEYESESVPSPEPVLAKTANERTKFNLRFSSDTVFEKPVGDEAAIPFLNAGDGVLASLVADRGGTVLRIEDAEFLRNRYLALDQNATLALWLVRKFLPEGGKVIFLEASAGNAESRNALDEAGKWAPAAFWQGLLLIFVVVATLAPRFGLASREFVTSRGAKELMSAMSLVLLRAQRHDHALAILRQSCIERIRHALRLPIGLPENEVISRVHPDFQALLSQVAAMQGREVGRGDAVQIANGLTKYISELENEEKAKRSIG